MAFDLKSAVFKRRCSGTLYRDRKLKLGEMSLARDFVTPSRRGDLYPILEKSEDAAEWMRDARYGITAGRVTRLLGQHFPYATFEVSVEELDGDCGFYFTGPDGFARITVRRKNDACLAVLGVGAEETTVEVPREFRPGMSLLVTARKSVFDVHFKDGDAIFYVTTFAPAGFDRMAYRSVFTNTTAALTLAGRVSVNRVEFYMDSGVAQADIRPVRYEDGTVLVEQGKIYLTASVRMQESGYQAIFSWIPGTAEFALTGALFYDAGDGMWANNVAVSLLYHRKEKRWLFWVPCFTHGHRLGCGFCEGDPRFGVNVVDVAPLPFAREEDEETAFLGRKGDEDPDFFYDSETDRWHMTFCRLFSDGENGESRYRYVHYESSLPLEGYRFVDRTPGGNETGGSIVPVEGRRKLICGASFEQRALYYVYDLEDLSVRHTLTCDYDDGGFRGWGTVIPVKAGSRIRYYWLTFDRTLGSQYNWSYGNYYCFEAE